MSKFVTLGGDRLGSGKKQKIELHGFERSTHDLGYVWRNTQAPGTLVPFLVQLALPGDTYDINLGADVKTHPTIGPLFASFKLQLDVFECPIRLYHSWLHNNKLNVGLNMSSVKLPQLAFNLNPLQYTPQDFIPPIDLQQINPSSLLAYLGIRGIGQGDLFHTSDTKNAIPLLAYWDIFKNYYANKQEEKAYVIQQKPFLRNAYGYKIYQAPLTLIEEGELPYKIFKLVTTGNGYFFNLAYTVDYYESLNIIPNKIYVYYYAGEPLSWNEDTIIKELALPCYDLGSNVYESETWTPDQDYTIIGLSFKQANLKEDLNRIRLGEFFLSDIDRMRDDILMWNPDGGAFTINKVSTPPYNFPLMDLEHPQSTGQITAISPMEGLALKTYQSDIFNNWVNSEFIDGAGGINEITSVQVTGNKFEIDALNLATKVYKMLNRIAVSGGSYDEWLEAVYDHTPYQRAETPMYHGGLSKEVIFQEVISNSATEGEPLGTLAGRGKMSDKHKGGQVTIKINEPGFIIGIVSLTPRIDYHQGNEFYVNHLTMDDLHKPNLDEIGFQDLVTDKMAFWDTRVEDGVRTFKSAGKQPAWLDYMTNYNKLYGNFADERNEMFMTLARRYEAKKDEGQAMEIKDLTTYIDPTKFNYAFAQTDLTAMNFWVQIGVDITARRKMSSKVMPNL